MKYGFVTPLCSHRDEFGWLLIVSESFSVLRRREALRKGTFPRFALPQLCIIFSVRVYVGKSNGSTSGRFVDKFAKSNSIAPTCVLF